MELFSWLTVVWKLLLLCVYERLTVEIGGSLAAEICWSETVVCYAVPILEVKLWFAVQCTFFLKHLIILRQERHWLLWTRMIHYIHYKFHSYFGPSHSFHTFTTYHWFQSFISFIEHDLSNIRIYKLIINLIVKFCFSVNIIFFHRVHHLSFVRYVYYVHNIFCWVHGILVFQEVLCEFRFHVTVFVVSVVLLKMKFKGSSSLSSILFVAWWTR